jgi:hypothetical protein
MSGTVRDPALPRTVPLEQGETVGGWRVVRHVADGGFSSVYEVRPATAEIVDRHGAAPRALKCVWGTPAELTAMNSEAARTRDVTGHPGVVELVTSFRFERASAPHHHVGLVLELADEDLPTFAARVTPGERAWAAVFEQVAAGLEHIHARRVVHGDIKPTNVLRVGGRFAVADFGVSAPLESTRSAGIGLARTIAFWPPESATQGVLLSDGSRRPPVEGWRASQAGDVWALAVSAHRMLTGRHITAGTTPEQQYELVCLGRYAVDGRLSPGWRALLEDCLVQDPARRRVSTSAQLRSRLAELAVPPAYGGAPWPVGAPRLAALIDLDPRAGGPLLALSLDRPGGRVRGELVPSGGVLPAALHHLTTDVLPALTTPPARAARPTGSAGSGGRPGALAAGVDPLAGGAGRADPDDPAATHVVDLAELDRTRQLAAVAAADRDRMTRSRDDAVADRDRLRRDHEVLARRLDRLEQEAALRDRTAVVRAPAGDRTAVVPARREPTLMLAPADLAEPDPDPVLTWRGAPRTSWREDNAEAAARQREAWRAERAAKRTAPGRATAVRESSREPAREQSTARAASERAAAEERRGTRPSTGRAVIRPAEPVPAAPAAAPAPRRKLFRRTRRMIRRLVVLCIVLTLLAFGVVSGASMFAGTSPDRILDRVTVVLEQVRNGGS